MYMVVDRYGTPAAIYDTMSSETVRNFMDTNFAVFRMVNGHVMEEAKLVNEKLVWDTVPNYSKRECHKGPNTWEC
jgi:hypothetical protein